MNRRKFIRRLTAGVVGTAVAINIAPSVLKAVGFEKPLKRWATERLMHLYRAHVRATGKAPKSYYVGWDFYEAFMDELHPSRHFADVSEYSSGYTLFKMGRVIVSRHVKGSYAAAVGHEWTKKEWGEFTTLDLRLISHRLYALRSDGKEFHTTWTLDRHMWKKHQASEQYLAQYLAAQVINAEESMDEYLDPFAPLTSLTT